MVFTHKGVASDGEGARKHVLFLVSYVKEYSDTLGEAIKSVQMRL
jgi:hypothetical protein